MGNWGQKYKVVARWCDEHPLKLFLYSALTIITVTIVGAVTAGWISGLGGAEESKRLRDQSSADIQARLPADCGFSDLGIYRPNRHTAINVIMIRCEGKAVTTVIQSEKKSGQKVPRQIITPFLQNEGQTDGN